MEQPTREGQKHRGQVQRDKGSHATWGLTTHCKAFGIHSEDNGELWSVCATEPPEWASLNNKTSLHLEGDPRQATPGTVGGPATCRKPCGRPGVQRARDAAETPGGGRAWTAALSSPGPHETGLPPASVPLSLPIWKECEALPPPPPQENSGHSRGLTEGRTGVLDGSLLPPDMELEGSVSE